MSVWEQGMLFVCTFTYTSDHRSLKHTHAQTPPHSRTQIWVDLVNCHMEKQICPRHPVKEDQEIGKLLGST